MQIIKTLLGQTSKSAESCESASDYFIEARSWADDMYTTAIAQRNRWRGVCLYACFPLIAFFCFWLSMLIPNQHVEPFLVHHYDSGLVSVEPMGGYKIVPNWPQTASNIVKYINNLVTYQDSAYKTQYENVVLLSSHEVAKQYIQAQSVKNPESLVNQLGSHSLRKVRIETIIPLDSKTTQKTELDAAHQNLAKVDFTVTEENRRTGKKITISQSMLISWEYRQMSRDPIDAWKNWDGFTVTSYSIHHRNL